MLNLLKGLIGGAGSIAGLLPFAPWIIAAVIGLGGVGGWFWQQHQINAAHEATVMVQQRLDAANVALGTAEAANAADEATIAAMQKNQADNDALIAEYQQKAADAAQQAADTGAAIRKLQANDQDINAFLMLSIPPALRSLLNHEPIASSAGANQNGKPLAAKTK